jgi:hypothetical protein
MRQRDVAGQCRWPEEWNDRDTGQPEGLSAGRIGVRDVDRTLDWYTTGDRRPMAQHRLGPDRGNHSVQVVASDLLGREARSDGVQSGSESLGFSSLGESTQSAVLGFGGSDELAVGRRRREFHAGKSARIGTECKKCHANSIRMREIPAKVLV